MKIIDTEGIDFIIYDIKNAKPLKEGWYRVERLNKEEINQFYCGATHIASAIENGCNAPITHETFKQCEREAQEKLAKDQSLKSVIIVQIVAIVRRELPPTTTEVLQDDFNKEK